MNDTKCRMEKNCFPASSTRTTILPLKIGNVFLMKLDQGMLQKHSMWNLWQNTVDLIFEFHQYERLYLKKTQGFPLKHILHNALSTLMHTCIRQQHPFTELLNRWICSCINQPINRPIQFLLTYKKSNVIPFSFWVVNLHGKNCYSDVGLVGICLHKCYFFVQYTTS